MRVQTQRIFMKKITLIIFFFQFHVVFINFNKSFPKEFVTDVHSVFVVFMVSTIIITLSRLACFWLV